MPRLSLLLLLIGLLASPATAEEKPEPKEKPQKLLGVPNEDEREKRKEVLKTLDVKIKKISQAHLTFLRAPTAREKVSARQALEGELLDSFAADFTRLGETSKDGGTGAGAYSPEAIQPIAQADKAKYGGQEGGLLPWEWSRQVERVYKDLKKPPTIETSDQHREKVGGAVKDWSKFGRPPEGTSMNDRLEKKDDAIAMLLNPFGEKKGPEILTAGMLGNAGTFTDAAGMKVSDFKPQFDRRLTLPADAIPKPKNGKIAPDLGITATADWPRTGLSGALVTAGSYVPFIGKAFEKPVTFSLGKTASFTDDKGRQLSSEDIATDYLLTYARENPKATTKDAFYELMNDSYIGRGAIDAPPGSGFNPLNWGNWLRGGKAMPNEESKFGLGAEKSHPLTGVNIVNGTYQSWADLSHWAESANQTVTYSKGAADFMATTYGGLKVMGIFSGSAPTAAQLKASSDGAAFADQIETIMDEEGVDLRHAVLIYRSRRN